MFVVIVMHLLAAAEEISHLCYIRKASMSRQDEVGKKMDNPAPGMQKEDSLVSRGIMAKMRTLPFVLWRIGPDRGRPMKRQKSD